MKHRRRIPGCWLFSTRSCGETSSYIRDEPVQNGTPGGE